MQRRALIVAGSAGPTDAAKAVLTRFGFGEPGASAAMIPGRKEMTRATRVAPALSSTSASGLPSRAGMIRGVGSDGSSSAMRNSAAVWKSMAPRSSAG